MAWIEGVSTGPPDPFMYDMPDATEFCRCGVPMSGVCTLAPNFFHELVGRRLASSNMRSVGMSGSSEERDKLVLL